jgi:hypothetical protein
MDLDLELPCVIITRCCDSTPAENHLWFFMKYIQRPENVAPFITRRSRATWGSLTTTKSWLPIQIEYSGPYILVQAWRARSGYLRRKGKQKGGPGGMPCPSLSTMLFREIKGAMAYVRKSDATEYAIKCEDNWTRVSQKPSKWTWAIIPKVR